MRRDNYLKCPYCNEIMVLKTRRSDGKPFFSCRSYPNCRGTRDFIDGAGKDHLMPYHGIGASFDGTCCRCGKYPAYGELSPIGLCPSCQEIYQL